MKTVEHRTPPAGNPAIGPLLSICIATYNRAGCIGETLESIIPQLTDEVEMVIVDGASTDNTSQVVERYLDRCKRIRYVRLPSKGGVDLDYCRAVESARGEYCWLFTDDDLMEPGAVHAVLVEARKGFSLIVVNARVMNGDLSKTITRRALAIKENEIYGRLELDRLFRRVISYLSFIGGVVIRRDLWRQRERERYFGTEFIHVGVIFQASLPSSTLVLANPFVVIRFGNAQWKPRSFEIWMHKWPRLLCTFSEISERARRPYQKEHSWLKLKTLIILRANKEYTLKEYSQWLAPANSAFWWKAVALLIALTPTFMLRFFRWLRCRMAFG